MEKGTSGAPKVTFCLPAYNHEDYVAFALMSLLAQRYDNLEILVSDNGSTDSTGRVIEQVAARDHRVTIYHDDHVNMASSHNRLLRRATGEFIALMHADDLAHPERVSKQVAYLQQHDQISIVFTLADFVDRHNQHTVGLREIFNTPMISDEIHENLLSGNFLCMSSMMIPRQTLKDVGYFDETLELMIDYDYWLRAMKVADLALIPEHLSIYRLHEKNNMVTDAPIMQNEGWRVLYKHYEDVLRKRPKTRVSVSDILSEIASSAMKCRQWHEAQEILEKKVKRDGLNRHDVIRIVTCMTKGGRNKEAQAFVKHVGPFLHHHQGHELRSSEHKEL